MKHQFRPLPTLLASLALALAACGGTKAKAPSKPVADSTAVPESSAEPMSQPMSQEQKDALAMMEEFLGDPQGTDAQPVVRYMRESPDVMVVIEQRLVGDDSATANENESALLLAGFIAGNIKAQIVGGRKENNPLGGVRGMLAVYAALQASSPTLSSPKLDAFAKHEAAGTLEAHLTELLEN